MSGVTHKEIAIEALLAIARDALAAVTRLEGDPDHFWRVCTVTKKDRPPMALPDDVEIT